jgi:hypothetical protein
MQINTEFLESIHNQIKNLNTLVMSQKRKITWLVISTFALFITIPLIIDSYQFHS